MVKRHPQLDDMRYGIHDFTDVANALLPKAEIEFLAVRASVAVLRNPRLKIAFVGNHHIVHELMDAFNNLGCAPNRVVRFNSLADAREYVVS